MSHDYEAIAIDRTDSVATITLSRPEALNAITPQMLEELTDAFRRLGPDHGVKAVSYTHLRAHETVLDLVCRLLLEKKKQKEKNRKRSKILRTHRRAKH